jgi:hypothetical protein
MKTALNFQMHSDIEVEVEANVYLSAYRAASTTVKPGIF